MRIVSQILRQKLTLRLHICNNRKNLHATCQTAVWYIRRKVQKMLLHALAPLSTVVMQSFELGPGGNSRDTGHAWNRLGLLLLYLWCIVDQGWQHINKR